MPEKNNPPKKKSKKAVPAAAKATRPKAVTKPTSVFYVSSPEVQAAVSQQKPKSENGASFATFAEARSVAIDALIGAIETAEVQLTKLKRAHTWEQLKGS